MTKLVVIGGQIAVGFGVLSIWEGVIRTGLADPFIFGQPTRIFHYLTFEALPGKQLWIDTGYARAGNAMAIVFRQSTRHRLRSSLR